MSYVTLVYMSKSQLIRISLELKAKLDKLKIVKRDTYQEVIERLIKDRYFCG